MYKKFCNLNKYWKFLIAWVTFISLNGVLVLIISLKVDIPITNLTALFVSIIGCIFAAHITISATLKRYTIAIVHVDKECICEIEAYNLKNAVDQACSDTEEDDLINVNYYLIKRKRLVTRIDNSSNINS